jgi:lipoprotein-releasing system permease protein
MASAIFRPLTARDGMLETTPDLLAALRGVPGVKTVRLTLERQALVSANGLTRGALLRGVRLEDLMSRDIVTRNVAHGELGAFDTRPGVVIGERLRQTLNVRAGDKITIVTHKLNESGAALAPVLASFLTKLRVRNTLVFIPLQTLQEDLEYDRGAVTRPRPGRSGRERPRWLTPSAPAQPPIQGGGLANAYARFRRCHRSGDDVHHLP